MDTDMWYDHDKNPYIVLTLTLSSSNMQKALDCIQFPEKYNISVPERLRILDIDSEPYWEDPKIKIIVSMSSDKGTIESMIKAIKKIDLILLGGK